MRGCNPGESRRPAELALAAMVLLPLWVAVALAGDGREELPRALRHDPAEEIAAARAAIQAGSLGWEAGITSVNRLPPELRPPLAPLPLPPGETGMLPPDAHVRRPSLRELPARWDWREHGGVTPVKNQGACGSCWDFAATAAFESVIKIRTGVEHDLSEQQVLVCNIRRYDCRGGWPDAAYELFMDPGAVAETCMPYTADDSQPCTQDSCEFVDTVDGHRLVGSDITTLKEKILDHPITVACTVTEEFYSYTGGCYENSPTAPVNHIVLLVGWDDGLCDGRGAWIAKNSWGPGWGEGGYFYAGYGSCNIGAFAQEILYGGPGAVEIRHCPLPDTDNTTEPYDVQCEVHSRHFSIDPERVRLHYRVGADWSEVPMTPLRPGETQSYRAQIPPRPLGATVEYWLSAVDITGFGDVDPDGAPGRVHSFRILRTFFSDDVETLADWTCGAPGDDATGGIWERGSPEATYGAMGRQGNPGEDHTPAPGELCYCTGCAAGASFWDHDVDGGRTTLLSPVVDLGSAEAATLTYYRWYTNDAGQWAGEDCWQVDITGDGTNWVSLEHTYAGVAAWVAQVFELGAYVDLPAQVQLRFVASDYLHASNIEGAVDDVEIVSIESGLQGVDAPPRLRRIRLRSAPNPFADATAIRLDLPRATEGVLRVLAVDGRVVRTLADGRLAAGTHRLIWDGRDAAGREAPAGVYLLRLNAPAGDAVGRILRLR